MKNVTLSSLPLLLVTLLLLSVCDVQSMHSGGGVCDPREMERSCLLGCMGCWNTFRGPVYDLEACCRECRVTGAFFVDPQCTKVERAWLKRFG